MQATGAGDLRDRVTFSKRAAATDQYGGAEGDWQDQFAVRAQITPRLGGETVIAARLQGTQPAVIRVRQTARSREVTSAWRVTDQKDATVYAIRSIVDPYQATAMRGRWLDILCEAGVAP